MNVEISIFPTDHHGDVLEVRKEFPIAYKGKSIVIIPAGFRSDGASVPEFLWASVSPRIDPRTLRGALAHDYIYCSGE